jgi:hypothetical protein
MYDFEHTLEPSALNFCGTLDVDIVCAITRLEKRECKWNEHVHIDIYIDVGLTRIYST